MLPVLMEIKFLEEITPLVKTNAYRFYYNYYKCNKEVQRTVGAYKSLSWLYGKGAVVLRLNREELVRISEESRKGGGIFKEEGSKGSLPLSGHFHFSLYSPANKNEYLVH